MTCGKFRPTELLKKLIKDGVIKFLRGRRSAMTGTYGYDEGTEGVTFVQSEAGLI